MSSDPYVPSDPPTTADWSHLEERAVQNRRRSRLGVIFGVVALIVVTALAAAGLGVYLPQRDVPRVLERQTVVLRKINEVVAGLQSAEAQRSAASKGQAIALAVIVENLAAFAATPPAPNGARLRAVEGFCATARQFRASAGDMNPPVCPAL